MDTLRTRASRVITGGILAGALTLGGAGLTLAQGHAGPFGGMPSAAGAASTGQPYVYGPGSGMMGGQSNGPGVGNITGQLGYAPGEMMTGYAPGGMAGGYGAGMGGWFGGVPDGSTISLTQAQQDAQAYLSRLGSPDFQLDEILEFQGNFYAIVKEHSTGVGAFEVLINKATGAVMREPGPDMLWNTKYGMPGENAPMAAWMGDQTPTGPMTVSTDQARQDAQRWLDANQPGSTTETPDQFYGYYTLHILKDGKVTGMLSVNGYTGQVWFHSWHGAFIQMKDLGQ